MTEIPIKAKSQRNFTSVRNACQPDSLANSEVNWTVNLGEVRNDDRSGLSLIEMARAQQKYDMNPLLGQVQTDESTKSDKITNKVKIGPLEGDNYDLFEDLNELERVKVASTLQDYKLTPFDMSTFTQVMFYDNPARYQMTSTNGSKSRPAQQVEELVTVQVFMPAVFKAQVPEPNEREEKFSACATCTNQHILKKQVYENDEPKTCHYCEKDIFGGDAAFSCHNFEQCDYFLCHECNLRHYIRKSIVNQTSQHFLYEEFELGVTDIRKQIDSNLFDQDDDVLNSYRSIQTKSDKMQELENQMKKLLMIDDDELESQVFASVVPVKNETNTLDQSTQISSRKEYAVVSFWSFDPIQPSKTNTTTVPKHESQYRCKRMFKIEGPAFLKIRHAPETVDHLLHQGQQKELVFFTKSKTTSQGTVRRCLQLNFVDQQAAFIGPEHMLTKLTSNLYQAPLLKQISFQQGQLIYELLQHMLIKKKKDESRALLDILNVNESIYLVLTAPYGLDEQWVEPQKRKERGWVQTDYENIIFIDVIKQEVVWIIYNAEVLITLTAKQDTGWLSDALFLREKSIIEMEWGSPNSKQTDQIKQNPPRQPYTRCYNMLPRYSVSNKNYLIDTSELFVKLQRCSSHKSLVQARLHYNEKKVTIIYAKGGIFTFKLDESIGLSKKSTFTGHIGEVRDFQMTNFVIVKNKIKASGKDDRGQWILHGQANMDNQKWSGFIQKDELMQVEDIQKLSVDDESIHGEGFENSVPYNIRGLVKYQEGGKTTVEFTKQFANKGNKDVYFEGSANDELTKIWGRFSQDQNNIKIGGRFKISMDSKINCHFDINYQPTGTIKLQGFIDIEKAILSGEVVKANVPTDQFFSSFAFPKELNDLRKPTFKLVSAIAQDRAEQIFGNVETTDAQFCRVIAPPNSTKLQKVYACGNLQLRTKKQSEHYQSDGFNTVDLDLIDLSQENVQMHQQVSCLLPNNFKERYDERGFKCVPYYIFTPFKVRFFETSTPDDYKVEFSTQMFFQDPIQNNRKVIFLHGRGYSNSARKKQLMAASLKGQPTNTMPIEPPIPPQWPPSMSENYIVQYPILAYKSNLATDNELVIVNLMLNKPQKFVNIDPYRFIQFISSDLLPERNLDSAHGKLGINTSIFILVELKGIFYLINYRTFPFPINTRYVDDFHRSKFQFNDEVRLVTGKFDPLEFQKNDEANLAQKLTIDAFTPEKIVKAALLQIPQSYGVQIVVVMQLMDKIVYLNLTSPEKVKGIVTDKQNKMLKLIMQIGPQDQIYFCVKTQHRIHTIVQLTYQDAERLTLKTVYAADNDKILAMQLEQRDSGDKGSDDSHFLFVLESSQRFKRIEVEGSKVNTKFTVNMVIDLSFNPGFENVFQLLGQNKWNQMMLNEIGIIALEVGGETEPLIATTLSTRSDLIHKHEFLGFEDDKKHKMLKQNRDQLPKQCNSVLSVSEIEWIDKHLFEVREGSLSYFLVTQHTCVKRIDLVRIDTELTMIDDIVLLGNHYFGVKLKYTHAYMLYNQMDFTYVEKTQPYDVIVPLTPVITGIQYFFCNLDDYQGSGEDESCMIRVNADGSIDKALTMIISYVRIVADYLDTGIPQLSNGKGVKNQAIPEPPQYRDQADSDCFWSLDTSIDNSHGFQLGVFYHIYLEGYHEIDEVQPDFVGQDNVIDVYIYKLGCDQILQQEIGDKMISYVVQCDQWQNNKVFRQQLFTPNYVVIKHGAHIAFVLRSAIDELEPTQLTDREKLKSVFRRQNTKSIKMKLINTNQLAKTIIENDFNISLVTKEDIDIADKSEERQDLIQITFGTLQILWDLDEHKEVLCVSKPHQLLNNRDNYVVTGFRPYMQSSLKSRHMKDIRYFSNNEDKSLIMTPKTDFFISEMFRTFTRINMYDVFEIGNKIKRNHYVADLDPNTVLQNFNGLTFFEIFATNEHYLNLIQNHIEKHNLKDNVDINISGEVSDNLFIRQLYWSLNIPITKDKTTEVERPNIVQQALFQTERQHMLDPYLKLLMQSRELKLSNLVANFNCFKQVLATPTAETANFLTKAFIENQQTLQVKSMQWNTSQAMVTFGSNYSLMTEQQIKGKVLEQQRKNLSFFEKIKDKFSPNGWMENLKTVQVRVKILEIEWLSEDLEAFYEYLSSVDDDAIFGNDLIKVLLEQQQYSPQIIAKMFVPYIVYMALCLLYFSYYLPNMEHEGIPFLGDHDSRFIGFVRIVILILGFFFMCVEVKQLLVDRLAYLLDYWNWFSWATNVIAVMIVLDHGHFHQLETVLLIQLSSVAIVLQWLTFTYWLRLFPDLSFYVHLTQETLADIGYFMIILLIVIMMFANAVFVLDQTLNLAEGEDESRQFVSFPEAIGVPFLDSLINMYNVGLGNLFTTNHFKHQAKYLLWIYFILATFFINVLIFNMLIAIMGQTFERVTEAKNRYQLKESTTIYGDFLWMINLTKELKNRRYLYVLKPIENADDPDNKVEETTKKIIEDMNAGFERTNEEIDVLKKKMLQLVSQHNSMNFEMKEGFQSMTRLLEEIKGSLGKR